jgi:BON domain
MREKVKDHAGVERTGPRSHHQPIDRGKAHRRGDAAAILDRAQAGTVAEMGDDEPAAGAIGRDLRQCRDDVFVGQAVKSVAPHALCCNFARQGELLGERRLRPVERGIEAGNLRDVGHGAADGADRGDLVRLVQWRERHQRFQRYDYLLVKQHRLRIRHAAMDDAVANAGEPCLVADMGHEPILDRHNRALERHHIKRLPVVKGDAIAGIVTRANLLHAFIVGSPKTTAPPVTDAAIREKLAAELEKQPWAPRGSFNAVVENGIVDLEGVIRDERQRAALRIAAENIPGRQTSPRSSPRTRSGRV